MLVCQINNIRISQQSDGTFMCSVSRWPGTDNLEQFVKLVDARRWAETTHDFLTPLAMEREIAGAWRALRMPKIENRNIVKEHDQWWVIGYDEEDQLVTYSVVEASGPGTYNGLAFEGV